MNSKHRFVKKAASIFIAGFFAAAIFFFGVAGVGLRFAGVASDPQAGMVNTAEASFLDTIVALVAINPLHLAVSAPAEVKVGKKFKVETQVENRGEERISNVRVELFISKGLVLVRKNLVKDVGTIRGNGTKTVSWQLKGIETGNFGISARASGEVRGDVVSAEGDTIFVAIVEKSSPGGPGPHSGSPRSRGEHFVQNFFAFFGGLLGKWF